eukprot:745_1
MPPTFSKLKFVNERSKIITIGYIRNIEKELHANYHNVPIGIKNLCVLYYFETEEFGKHSKVLMISSSNGSAKNDIAELMIDDAWYCVYGTIIIDKNNHPNSIYKWTLKLNWKKQKKDVLPDIGIVAVKDNNKLPLDMYCFNSFTNNYYAFELS